MDKTDSRLTGIKPNDVITVEASVFGQTMKVEGKLISKTESMVEILSAADNKPYRIPLDAIVDIKSKNIADDSCSEQSDNHNEESDIEINSEICSGYIIADYHKRDVYNSKSIPEANVSSLRQIFNMFVLMLISSIGERLFGNDERIGEIITKNSEKNIEILINARNNKTSINFERIDINVIRECITQQNNIDVREDYINNVRYVAEKWSDSLFMLFISIYIEISLKSLTKSIKELFFAIIYGAFISDSQSPSESDEIDEHANYINNFISVMLLQLSSESYINSLYDNKFECDDRMEDFCMKVIIQLSVIWHVLSFSGNFSNKELFKKIDGDETYIFYNEDYLADKYITCWSDFEENDNKNKCLLPILSVNSILNIRVFIQNTIYLLLLLNSHDFKIYVKNDADKEKIKFVLIKDFDVESKGDLTVDFRKIFSDFKEFFEELNSCTARLSKYVNGIIVPSFEHIDKMYNMLQKSGLKFVFRNPRTKDIYINFLSRIRHICGDERDISFDRKEMFLLKDKDYFNEQLRENPEEPYCFFLSFALRLLNKEVHSVDFSRIFYQKYLPELSIEIMDSSVGVNTDRDLFFVPIKFSLTSVSQPVSITALTCFCSNHVYNQLKNDKLSVDPESPNYIIMRLPLTQTLGNNRSRPLNLHLSLDVTFRYKESYDFKTKYFNYSSRSVAKEFCIPIEFKNEFTEINNVFNSYRSGCVVEDENMFFGRSRDIENILNNLRDEEGNLITNRCICIYGQTRTGKSSILYHLKNRLKADERNIVLDFGDISTLDVSDDGFRYKMLFDLAEEIEFEHPEIYENLSASDFDIRPDDSQFEKNPAGYFDHYMKRLRKNINLYNSQIQIIILVDEFTYVYDWIKNGRITPDFMRFWKGMIQNYKICAVIIGQDHMMKFINDSRFTNSFGAVKTQEVTYLSETDAAKLIREPVSADRNGGNSCSFSKETVDYLVNITHGSAYLLMNICADFVDYLNDMHVNSATIAHVLDFMNGHINSIEERLFEPLFNDKISLDSEESISENKKLLGYIAHHGNKDGYVSLDEPVLSEKYRERISCLKERHVLEVSPEGCRIAVRLYDMWLKNNTAKEQL